MRKKTGKQGATTVAEGDVLGGGLIQPPDNFDDFVQKIRDLKREATFLFAGTLGRMVVDRVYGGDLAEWRKRKETDETFRALVARLKKEKDLGVDKSVLSRAIGVYELLERFHDLADSAHLKMGHYVTVLGLPEKVVGKLLANAAEKKLSVAELRIEAAKYRTSDGRGRRPLLSFVKNIQRIGRTLEQPGGLLGDIHRIDEVDDKTAQVLLATLDRLSAEVDRLRGSLQSKSPRQLVQDVSSKPGDPVASDD